MVILILKINQKNHVSFMANIFTQNGHPFGRCGHFSLVEPFGKP
jgi:hypothetical protein